MKRAWVSGLFWLWLAVAVAGTGPLLSGCGQKGSLYFPDPEEQAETEKKKKS